MVITHKKATFYASEDAGESQCIYVNKLLLEIRTLEVTMSFEIFLVAQSIYEYYATKTIIVCVSVSSD